MNTSIYSQLILLNKNDTDHYLKRYVKLVSFFKERNVKKKKFIHHEHHIIPKAFGGLDKKENLVVITIREHFILHHLLYKAFPKSSMTTAFFAMCNNWGQMDFRVTSKVYEKLQIEKAERQSENVKKLITEQRHNFQNGEIARQTQRKLVADGRHHWLSGEIQRQIQNMMIEDGTHPLLEKNKVKKLCPHCKRTFDEGNYNQWHGDKCKLNPLFEKEIKPKVECPHCNKYFSKSMFTRYHNDNCKLKPNN